MLFHFSPTPTHVHAILNIYKCSTVLEGANRLWPQAQHLLDCLTSAEIAAAAHNLRGPAASTDAWPLDGHMAPFQVTAANEDAYYMHIAIRRTAAASRAEAAALAPRQPSPAPTTPQSPAETTAAAAAAAGGGAKSGKKTKKKKNGGTAVTGKGQVEGEGAEGGSNRNTGGGVEAGVGGAGKGGDENAGDTGKESDYGDADGGGAGRREGVDAKEVARVAAYVASSATLLYSRGELGEEEALLRDSLSAWNAHRKEEALR